ncbi:hypothetical protein SELMODRAFT_415980 [Selaginella moellendorffii]|uniref:Uncharacterized protein n=1 Tax=Selaginella moellendorffii TaxID=88036 RepID=D8RXP8_SELML|nr:uncharacterized protein LOC9645622 [Selaginella moellendorffii]XP_024536784.1 uncharacterized protein LOC9645622 [Selaginella moellendorffii]EFJ22952.1 hypothetical protein SELMODRAFT_415980 [Selaginella moellendorffii]|eukprot:XP_002976047.1 uncharacterized protein LOC9645622 [Selaginella moellendorffii]
MADKLVAAALQEIAAEGEQGCLLAKLWAFLQATPAGLEIHVDDHVKQAVWRGLLAVPGLSFKFSGQSNAAAMPASDPSIQSLQSAESLELVVVASQDIRDACLGLYDIRHADTQPSQIQHSILERLAKARTEGVTQNQLGKDFKVEGNKLFYILRSLESRGLVVRRSTLVRNKDTAKGGGSIVLTNLVHLTRYARHLTLNSHQRFEISNGAEDAAFPEDPDDADDNHSKGKHLMINDDLPAMKAICDKLQQAEGKVLVVSDLKLTLGYRMSSGHRAWRRLMKRLKEAGFVTIIEAKVGRKVRSCIQLLKAFNEHEFSASTSVEADTEQQLKGPKRGQVTEQLVELSVDQQIYDMIDEGGREGLMMMEVWKRIGLNNKRNYYRIQNMTIKNGILFEAENHKRSTLYRLRTTHRTREVPAEQDEDTQDPLENMEEATVPSSDSLKRVQKLPLIRKNAKKVESDSLTESMVKIDTETDAGNTVITTLPATEALSPAINETPEGMDITPVPTTPASSFPPPSLFRIGQPYPCLTVTTTSLQREQRILERLQEEKYVVRAELHRWLESISNRKTMMDRKTLTRTLQKLQREGRCKCILLSMPGSTNCGRKRTAEVVLLPSVKVEPDLLSVIHERIRKFDMESRGHGLPREKASVNTVPVLTGLRRMKVKHKKAPLLSQIDAAKTVALQANGFVPAKMVRARMLHYFLWNYTNDFLDEDMGLEFGTPRLTDGRGYRVFGLMAAVQSMPLELFLQMVGSNRVIDNLTERCRQGMRLRDLPEGEQVILLENSAGGRLAWLVDILRRLKLIRIVIGHGPVVLQDRWHLGSLSISMIEASLTYAMEEHMYIEQPAPQPLPSLTRETYDYNPRGRHEFDINTKEGLDNYWQTLEYFFSGAEPGIARHAFPGSSVPELFGLRSWTSLRIMTIDQRNDLVRRMNEGGPEKRKSIQECAKIAKDLNLTLEQVLRVSYEKNRRVRLQSLQKTEPSFMDTFASSHPAPPQVLVTEDNSRHEMGQMFTSGISEATQMEKEVDDADDMGDHVNHISIVTKLKPSRSRRFPWSDKLDRVLFFAYAKQRALLGAKMNRVDWNLIPGLPAAPLVCRRRISILKSEATVKKAILNLCSLLSARYEKYCQLMESIEDQGTSSTCEEQVVEDGELIPPAPIRVLHEQPEYYWDNPEDASVVSAIDEIIRCKNLVRSCYNKPCHNKRIVATSLYNSATETVEASTSGSITVDPLHLSSAAGLMQVSKRPPIKPNKTGGVIALRSRRVRKKVKKKPASLQCLTTEQLVHGSVGVANAIEFIKLVFLNTSVNSDDVQLPKAFMDALHQFKEADVFTAFNFLKDHGMVASGQGAQSFVLSDTFYQNAFATRFPGSTAEESFAMSKWLQERRTDIDQEWVPYSTEDTCGKLLQLFGRVTTGELTLKPSVPANGIGESEDPRSIGCGFKRKPDNQEQGARTVKARLEDKDEVYQAVRRERGFPGIDVLLHRETFTLPDLLSRCQGELEPGPSETPSFEVPGAENLEKVSGTEGDEILEPGLLAAMQTEIENAGEEGVNIKDLGQRLGTDLVEKYVDSLESSGVVKKVNAFDHVRVLSQAFAGRYFLQFSTKKTDRGSLLLSSPGKSIEKSDVFMGDGASTSTFMDIDPIEGGSNEHKACNTADVADLTSTLPILPWITSNGSLNMKILKGLIRRVMGIVTLNPGITEDNLVKRMNVLNPQTVKELLRMLLLDGKLIVRSVTYPPVFAPSLLSGLLHTSSQPEASAYPQQKHYYANALCTSAL